MGKQRFSGNTIAVTSNLGGAFMKKLCILTLVFVLVFVLAACGRRNDDMTTPTTQPTTQPATVPTTEAPRPQTDPTSPANIPDPDVEGAIPDGTDGMDGILDDITGNPDNSDMGDNTNK